LTDIHQGARVAPGRMFRMETVAKGKPRPRRPFTPEFKAEIVEPCRLTDRSIAQVAVNI
jgi:transposase-like protein